jgi:hypothetical protein
LFYVSEIANLSMKKFCTSFVSKGLPNRADLSTIR